MKYSYIIFLATFISTIGLKAQDDLDAFLDEQMADHVDYALGTFYSSRIVNFQSTQMMPKGGLDFRVHHRFDQVSEGYNRFWGIDGSHSYLSLEYGITDYLMAGIGRQSDAFFNGFAKVSVFRQQKSSKRTIPVNVVWVSTMAADAYNYENDKERNDDFSRRCSYTHQLLISRMFSPKLSLQLSPTFVHRNMVETPQQDNDYYALGIGGRYKLTNTFSVNAEYFYVIGDRNTATQKYYDPVNIGVDIQVSGHVFQIMLTNSSSMLEPGMLTQSSESFTDGDIRLGFNISMVFTLGRKTTQQ
ncbi:MAG TPA: DUF5777 family beta-barrel protein [Bacteroidales bacterium]